MESKKSIYLSIRSHSFPAISGLEFGIAYSLVLAVISVD